MATNGHKDVHCYPNFWSKIQKLENRENSLRDAHHNMVYNEQQYLGKAPFLHHPLYTHTKMSKFVVQISMNDFFFHADAVV